MGGDVTRWCEQRNTDRRISFNVPMAERSGDEDEGTSGDRGGFDGLPTAESSEDEGTGGDRDGADGLPTAQSSGDRSEGRSRTSHLRAYLAEI